LTTSESINNKNKILLVIDNKVLIKDNLKAIFFIILFFIAFYIFFFKINIKANTIIAFEQTIFVIISAIMLVFNESLISYSSISKIINLLNNLKKKETKDIIFSIIGKEEHELSPNYEEYLNTLNERIREFKKNIEIFRKNSYRLYTIFTISGFFAIICSLSILNIEISKLLSHNIYSFLHTIKPYLIEFFMILQISLIPTWLISAYQAEKQKSQILYFFEHPSEIVKDFKKYLEEIEEKEINMSLKNINEN
jgi:hypothetical protein